MSFKANITVLLVLLTVGAFAQPGVKDSIYSQAIGEERRLQIQLPKEYKPGSADKYPVLYLLDGEWNAELFEQAQRWLQQWGFDPPIIMVGVVNSYPNNQNQRARDLTPTSGGQTGTGGGPKLLAFLKNELVPYINKKYPSNGSGILWGHSLGGLFVLYALFTEPDLFDYYISADPSVWWDHGYVRNLAKEKMNAIKGIKSLFITGRTGNAWHGMGIDSLEMLLKASAPPNLQWKAVAYPDETHVSQQGKSSYDGLKYTLAPLTVDRIQIDPMGGIVVKGMPFALQCYNNISEKFIRYSIDGTPPTVASSALKSDNLITPGDDFKLNIKTFLVTDSLNKSLTADFKTGKPLVPGKKPVQAVKGGWNYGCYKTAAATEVIKSGVFGDNPPDIGALDSTDYFLRMSGYLETVKKGYYVFKIYGASGSKIYLGDQLLMEIAEGKDFNSFVVPLEKGFYPIRFESTHHKGGNGVGFSYQAPGDQEDGNVPPSVMYH